MEMTSFFDWATLGTLAGSTAAVSVATQILKEIKPLQKIPTQIVSYILACIVLLAATIFVETSTGTLTAATIAIVPINAILVALSSNGLYSAIKRVSGGSV